MPKRKKEKEKQEIKDLAESLQNAFKALNHRYHEDKDNKKLLEADLRYVQTLQVLLKEQIKTCNKSLQANHVMHDYHRFLYQRLIDSERLFNDCLSKFCYEVNAKLTNALCQAADAGTDKILYDKLTEYLSDKTCSGVGLISIVEEHFNHKLPKEYKDIIQDYYNTLLDAGITVPAEHGKRNARGPLFELNLQTENIETIGLGWEKQLQAQAEVVKAKL